MPSDATLAQLAQFKNIPNELKALKQWVCWRAENVGAAKLSKIPYTPTGQKASVTNPATWNSFEEVCVAYNTEMFNGIGFVFTDDDPYTFVDLDQSDDPIIIDRQQKIYSQLNSYSELSPSGRGLHIICKASLPMGRRRNSIELYSSERYATFTGHVYNNVGIRECQSEIFALFEQLGDAKPQQFVFKGEVAEKNSDEEIIKIASDAVNGDKFNDLFKGNWQSYYPSQSEADFALVNIIAFYTKNRPQISRIFRLSGLGKRDKAKRQDYLNYMINRSFDRELPPIDMDGLKIEVEKVIQGNSLTVKPSPHKTFDMGSNPVSPTILGNYDEYNKERSFTSFNETKGSKEETRSFKSESSQQEALRKQQSLLSSSQQKEDSGSEALVSRIQENFEVRAVFGESSGSVRFSSYKSQDERGIDGPTSGNGMEQGANFKRNSEMHGSLRQLSQEASLGGKEFIDKSIYNYNVNAGSFNGRTTDFDSVNESSTLSPAANIFKSPPPGLVGEIAQFIYQAAPRPVPEIAIATAIGLMAGICGRAYNVSSTGLNQYILLLAKTGRGKEAIQSGISKLIAAVAQQVPTVGEKIGPDEIASGQALYKYLNKAPGFVSVLSEFGIRLQQLSDVNGNGPNISLRRMMLQLYAKSGFNDVARPSIYSDKDKNIPAIHSPAFSILGESTPLKFYQNLNEDMISEGLLPRFLLIEYDGDRVPENDRHAEIKPSFELIDKLAAIAANAQTVESASPRRVITVNFSDDAFKLSKKYSAQCDGYINNKQANEVILELWNRAHLKAIKLAAIVAVGVNMWNPTIEVSHLEWAIELVNEDIKKLTKRFESGRIGANTTEVKQIDEVSRIIKDYLSSDWKEVYKYCTKKDEKLHSEKVVTYSYISKRLMAAAAFRNDRLGATNALKRSIQVLLERDFIQEVPREQLKQKFGTIQKSYMVTNMAVMEKDEDGG